MDISPSSLVRGKRPVGNAALSSTSFMGCPKPITRDYRATTNRIGMIYFVDGPLRLPAF